MTDEKKTILGYFSAVSHVGLYTAISAYMGVRVSKDMRSNNNIETLEWVRGVPIERAEDVFWPLVALGIFLIFAPILKMGLLKLLSAAPLPSGLKHTTFQRIRQSRWWEEEMTRTEREGIDCQECGRKQVEKGVVKHTVGGLPVVGVVKDDSTKLCQWCCSATDPYDDDRWQTVETASIESES